MSRKIKTRKKKLKHTWGSCLEPQPSPDASFGAVFTIVQARFLVQSRLHLKHVKKKLKHGKKIKTYPVMKTGHPRANFGPPAPAPANTRTRNTRRYGCGFPPLPWVCKRIAGLYYRSVFTTWADSTLSCSTSLTLILGPKNNVIIK